MDYRANVDIPIYREDLANVQWVMNDETNDGIVTKTNLAVAFDEIVLQIRTGPNPFSQLINSYTLTGGQLVISDKNVLNANLSQDIREGTYYYDLALRKTGENKFLTYIAGEILVTNDRSRL